ncbi:hypothetical protein Chor_008143 [Crotalus horridus]
MGILFSLTGTLADLECPSGWSSYDRYCYKPFKQEMTWADAEPCSSISYENLVDPFECFMGFVSGLKLTVNNNILSYASSRDHVKIRLCEVWRSKEAPHLSPPPTCRNLCSSPFAQWMLSVAGSGFAAPDGSEGPINSA